MRPTDLEYNVAMNRTATRAWARLAPCAIALVLTASSLLLVRLNSGHPGGQPYGHWVEATLIALGFSVVGAVIVSRRSTDNLVGWLFCAVGLLWSVVHLCAEYAIHATLTAPGTLPGGRVATVLFTWLWAPELALIAFLCLLFPNGRLPSPNWRWFARLYGLVTAACVLLSTTAPGPFSEDFPVRNPLGIEGMPEVSDALEASMLGGLLIAALSLLLRLRRARGVERQQIKWFAYAAPFGISGAMLKYTIGRPLGAEGLEWVGFAVLTIGILSVPVAMGIAMLRYRLYDIDIIIRRTLVYGVLTATLTVVYFASTAILGWALGSGEGFGQAGIVTSTLLTAALFQPLRVRVKAAIDRRFYRRRYDAVRLLANLGATLEAEVELERLGTDVLGVVEEAVQPSHASLWLRWPEEAWSQESHERDAETGHRAPVWRAMRMAPPE